MRILITGSRDWVDVDTIRQAIADAGRAAGVHPREVTVVHGDCRTGADRIADQVARQLGCAVERHPADWAREGRAAGPRRNARMIAAGADLVLVFPLGASVGTRGCMRLAEQAGIPVTVYEGAAAA